MTDDMLRDVTSKLPRLQEAVKQAARTINGGMPSTPAAPSLPDDLSAILSAHSVPPTVDGLLAAFEALGRWIDIAGRFQPQPVDADAWDVELTFDRDHVATTTRHVGPTALIALARAFAAMVETE